MDIRACELVVMTGLSALGAKSFAPRSTRSIAEGPDALM